MTNKVKKQATSLSFTLSRIFSKISTIRPSTTLIFLTLTAVSLFLFSGGLYAINNAFNPDLAQRLPVYAYINNNFHFIYSRSIGGSLGDQFGAEIIIAYTLYAMGFIGMLAFYQSSKHAYKPRQAHMTLIVGLALLFLAYFFLESVIGIKLYG